MMETINRTPFTPFAFSQINMAGEIFTVCLLKVSVQFQDQIDATVEVMATQPVMEDTFWDSPTSSSLREESDLTPFKPCADLYFSNAVAYSPARSPLQSWEVAFRIGALHKQLRVYGEREWVKRRISGWTIQAPKPCEKVSIRYENAYGGAPLDPTLPCYELNPVGRGHFLTQKNDSSFEAPQIEAIDTRIKVPGTGYMPAGFGAIARSWAPRLALAGTYDENWIRSRWPFWPENLNTSFFNAAPADQHLGGYATGAEVIELTNLTPALRCRFQLPFSRSIRVAALGDGDEGVSTFALLDTIVIDAEAMIVKLTWRAGLDLHSPRVLLIDFV